MLYCTVLYCQLYCTVLTCTEGGTACWPADSSPPPPGKCRAAAAIMLMRIMQCSCYHHNSYLLVHEAAEADGVVGSDGLDGSGKVLPQPHYVLPVV